MFQCRACDTKFRSEAAFNMHRTGKHGIPDGPERRRCMDEWEMLDKGMGQNGAGLWVTALMPTGFIYGGGQGSEKAAVDGQT
jgi:hypothetical protein